MIQSPLLLSFSSIRHAFTVKDDVGEDIRNSLILPRQTHSDQVTIISRTGRNVMSDGLITRMHQVPIGITTADCVPVLLADPESGVVSAVHAGWRGTVENIVQKAVQSLIGMGSSARSLRAAIGPSIKSCCYDIPPDRRQLFREKFGTKTIVNTHGTDYIDLQEINYRQLLEVGLSYDHIDVIDECTKCNAAYYSYRRGDRDKRMVSYIYRV